MSPEAEIDTYIGWFEGVVHGGSARKLLETMGFFDAPASGSHHLAERGGLARHSANVTRRLLDLTDSLNVYWPRVESPYIVGMCHDIVKCRCYKFKTIDGKERIVRRAIPYSGHGAASAIIAACELGIRLYPEEAAAIVHHMGAFNLSGNDLKDYDAALSLYPLQIIAAHTADMLAARVDEEFDCEGLA